MATTLEGTTNSTPRSCVPASSDVRSCLSFKALWAAHPLNWNPEENKPFRKPNGLPKENPEGLYENQCAIKMSISLIDGGLSLDTYPKARSEVREAFQNKKKYRGALAAEELAAWLSKALGKPEEINPSEAYQKVKGKTGIIFFKDFWARSSREEQTGNFSGDHIDLWNGSTMPGSNWRSFGESIHSDPRNSYFLRSKLINFWEIK
ncbi:MAG: hypothetical protein C4K60_17115 [Ideonella sp. MAG2]|nr:MAG: hypothetical protein C4K60_17115 [Ideonella sp. MAG2]